MRHGHAPDLGLTLGGWTRDTEDEGACAPPEVVEAAVVESACENVHVSMDGQ